MQRFTLWRGLIVSIFFIVGLPEPLTRDVEHISSTLLPYLYFKGSRAGRHERKEENR